jgi:hypothetical protein
MRFEIMLLNDEFYKTLTRDERDEIFEAMIQMKLELDREGGDLYQSARMWIQ